MTSSHPDPIRRLLLRLAAVFAVLSLGVSWAGSFGHSSCADGAASVAASDGCTCGQDSNDDPIAPEGNTDSPDAADICDCPCHAAKMIVLIPSDFGSAAQDRVLRYAAIGRTAGPSPVFDIFQPPKLLV